MSVEILLLRIAFGSIGSSAVIKSLNFSDKDKQKLNQRRHPNTDDHGADLIESLRGYDDSVVYHSISKSVL